MKPKASKCICPLPYAKQINNYKTNIFIIASINGIQVMNPGNSTVNFRLTFHSKFDIISLLYTQQYKLDWITILEKLFKTYL